MAKKTGKTTSKKTVPKKSKKAAPKKSKVNKTIKAPELKQEPVKQSFIKRRFKFEKPPKGIKKLPTAASITKKTLEMLWENRQLLIGVVIIYGLLNLILVQGFSGGSNISNLKSELKAGKFSSLLSGLSIFAVLVGSSGNNTSATAGAYQLPLTVITFLAIIWALRQVMNGQKFRVRDAYYKGMYPLIPFILVLLYIRNGVAIGLAEKLIFLSLFLVLAFWSLYMLCSSIFALYIVTLPDMTPMRALRSAKELVKFRRLDVFRKLIALPVLLYAVAAIIMLPIIFWLTVIGQWVFFILTMFALLAANAYIYNIYKELLDE
jgi:hypothetical protein